MGLCLSELEKQGAAGERVAGFELAAGKSLPAVPLNKRPTPTPIPDEI